MPPTKNLHECVPVTPSKKTKGASRSPIKRRDLSSGSDYDSDSVGEEEKIQRRFSTANLRSTPDAVSSIISSGNVIKEPRLQSLHRRQLRVDQVPGRLLLSGARAFIGMLKRKGVRLPRGVVGNPCSRTTPLMSTKTMAPRRTWRWKILRLQNPMIKLQAISLVFAPLKETETR